VLGSSLTSGCCYRRCFLLFVSYFYHCKTYYTTIHNRSQCFQKGDKNAFVREFPNSTGRCRGSYHPKTIRLPRSTVPPRYCSTVLFVRFRFVPFGLYSIVSCSLFRGIWWLVRSQVLDLLDYFS